jgi:hypothetical protein
VNIGDTVYVVDDKTFEVHKTKVDSNPSEIIWATIKTSLKRSEAFGPHRWATTEAEAQRLAKKLAANSR